MTTNINFSFTRLMAVMKRDMMENCGKLENQPIQAYSMLFRCGYGFLVRYVRSFVRQSWRNRRDTISRFLQYIPFHTNICDILLPNCMCLKNNGSDEYKKQTYLVYDASGNNRRKVHQQSNICMFYFYGYICCRTVFCRTYKTCSSAAIRCTGRILPFLPV